MRFTRFIAIDWSGARSGYARKLQVAQCRAGSGAPALVTCPGGWTRQGICDWLAQDMLKATGTLVGFDFSFAPPFMDCGAYLPGLSRARTARAFWAELDAQCDDADLGAAGFLARHRGTHFYLGAVDGVKARFMRLRACEQAFNASGGGKPSSVFDAIGAAQVAKASFAGMRLLHRLGQGAAIWPFDPAPERGSLVVEMYCRAFIRLGGARGVKLRSLEALNGVLEGLGSRPVRALPGLDDDKTDALVAAAGLRAIADQPHYWHPAGLTPALARTEGWTFGVA